MRLFSDQSIIPAIMFHSVGLEHTEWIYNHLSMPVSILEDRLAYLVGKGWNFIHWADLYDHMAGRRKISLPAVMLTFDDGYLDNWVFLYPILKKYGAKATIFVNPDFVDQTNELRPTMDDLLDVDKKDSPMQASGFLSWAEMREMESSGLVDIQSHALTHTWYFSGPDIKDFHKPSSDKYPWLAWNARPERKPYYMTEDQSGFVPLGMPIYNNMKSLVCRRYEPPQEVVEGITTFVKGNGGPEFFCNDDWHPTQLSRHEELMDRYGKNGEIESEVDYQNRVLYELRESKNVIEKNLEKRVDYICWPGGGYNKEVVRLAKTAGYKAWTLGSQDQSDFRNGIGHSPEQIKRMGCAPYFQIPGRQPFGYANPRYFYCGIERHKGSFYHKFLGRGILVANYLSYIAGWK